MRHYIDLRLDALRAAYREAHDARQLLGELRGRSRGARPRVHLFIHLLSDD